MPRLRSKRWCFTLNNPSETERELLHGLVVLNVKVDPVKNPHRLTYLVFGNEEESTVHLQGYVELSQKTSLSAMKNFLSRAHWEKAKGTSQQASEYCKKDGNYEEAGKLLPGKGTRSDLLTIQEEIKNGASEHDIAEQHFAKWVVYRKSFSAYRSLLATQRNWNTRVIVLWGNTGVGKTRFVYDQIMDLSLWTPGDYKWFDGYTGQDIVLFDEYRGQYDISLFLKLTDRYPMSVPIKGGFTNWRPRKIYITSNSSPCAWYSGLSDKTEQAMWRRLETVHFIKDDIYE